MTHGGGSGYGLLHTKLPGLGEKRLPGGGHAGRIGRRGILLHGFKRLYYRIG
jgi:hypothetical protein